MSFRDRLALAKTPAKKAKRARPKGEGGSVEPTEAFAKPAASAPPAAPSDAMVEAAVRRVLAAVAQDRLARVTPLHVQTLREAVNYLTSANWCKYNARGAKLHDRQVMLDDILQALDSLVTRLP